MKLRETPRGWKGGVTFERIGSLLYLNTPTTKSTHQIEHIEHSTSVEPIIRHVGMVARKATKLDVKVAFRKEGK